MHRALAAEKAQRDAPDGLASDHGKAPPYNCCLYARKHLLNTSQRSHGSADSFATGRGHFGYQCFDFIVWANGPGASEHVIRAGQARGVHGV